MLFWDLGFRVYIDAISSVVSIVVISVTTVAVTIDMTRLLSSLLEFL